MLKHRLVVAASLLVFVSSAAVARPWTVKPQWVAAHEAFLASDALRGRKSASPDEAIAAAYVAAQFQSYGLMPAPGMDGYLQTAGVVTPKLTGHAVLSAGTAKVIEGDGLTLLYSNGKRVSGNLAVTESDDIANLPAGDILLINNPGKTPLMGWWRAARSKGVKLLIVRESDDSRALMKRFGGQTGTAPQLDSGQNGMGGARPDLITLSDAAFAQVAAANGQTVTLDLGGAALERSVTTNAIGYLEGSDPSAGVILVTAHLDHLGVRPDGTIMHGANDDASGTVAVLEVAHALAAGKKPKRGILFVAYGAEEIGGLGSTYFGEHPPIPLDRIVAHLDLPFMTQAIQSLIVPVEYLINSDFKPEWKPGGKPEAK